MGRLKYRSIINYQETEERLSNQDINKLNVKNTVTKCILLFICVLYYQLHMILIFALIQMGNFWQVTSLN